jgi:cytochrome c biogenesis factor
MTKIVKLVTVLLILSSVVFGQDTYIKTQLTNFKKNLGATINSNSINVNIDDVSVTVGTNWLNNVKYVALISTTNSSTILPSPANNRDTIQIVKDVMKKNKVRDRWFSSAFFALSSYPNDTFSTRWALEYN